MLQSMGLQSQTQLSDWTELNPEVCVYHSLYVHSYACIHKQAYTYIYIYVYTPVFIHIYVHTHLCMCMEMFLLISLCMFQCNYIPTWRHMQMYTCMCRSECTSVYLCVYICIQIHVYMYIHVYMHVVYK